MGTTHHTPDLEPLLRSIRYDLIPFSGFREALDPLPERAPVAITLAPSLGIDRTVERAETAAAAGFDVAPHVGARFIRDRDHLESIVDRLTAAGVTNLFVPGGDRDAPIGSYECALDVLEALEEMGAPFEEIGIAGYPTGHDSIPDDVLVESLEAKAPHATYIVTQLCFEADAIGAWLEALDTWDVDLPVEVGIPGVVDYRRLMRMSWQYGVARPISFLRRTTGLWGFVSQLLIGRGRYQPDELIEQLAHHHADSTSPVNRVRLYTFNQTGPTVGWLEDRLRDATNG